MATEKQKQDAWERAQKIRGKNPNRYRRDELGNEIYKAAYGKEGEKGWEIDHRKPQSKGGSDSAKNLRALQTKANRKKGDKYPAKRKRKK